jgi:alanine racemase
MVGRICMDQCMIDLTGLSAKVGDEVILFGSDGKNTISIDDVAAYVGTINYEVVCMIDKRVPRVYTKDGKVVKVRDYVLEL